MNGWPAGTPIPNTEFEIYNARTGNLVDTIKTDKNGVASSRPLPLGRYKIVESKAADFYGLDQTPIEVEIEYAGQIVKAAMTNKSLYTNVSIKKTGYVEVMPGQQIRYDFSGIGNNSTTSLTSFYWRDTLPTQAVRLDKIVTGTYNVPGNYKVVYKTNLNPNYRTMYDNLSTQQNYVLDASPAALGLASNEVSHRVHGGVRRGSRQLPAGGGAAGVLQRGLLAHRRHPVRQPGGCGRRLQRPVDHGHLPLGDQGLQARGAPAPHRLLSSSHIIRSRGPSHGTALHSLFIGGRRS